jgi:hypothetical protein
VKRCATPNRSMGRMDLGRRMGGMRKRRSVMMANQSLRRPGTHAGRCRLTSVEGDSFGCGDGGVVARVCSFRPVSESSEQQLGPARRHAVSAEASIRTVRLKLVRIHLAALGAASQVPVPAPSRLYGL